MSRCGSCNLPIRWAIVESTGKRMPLNPDPVSDGNVIVVRLDRQQTPIVLVLRDGEDHDGLRFRSHFASCPDARRHRRPR